MPFWIWLGRPSTSWAIVLHQRLWRDGKACDFPSPHHRKWNLPAPSPETCRTPAYFRRVAILRENGVLRRNRHFQFSVPGLSRFDGIIHCIDVLDAFFGQPFFERLHALFGVDRNTIFPGGPAAKHAREIRAGLSGHVQGFDELLIADARAQIN